jgi:uncharacterized protein (DUF488 family)
MYYRRKIVLALLEQFDDQLSKTDLQKLLMLVSEYQKKPSYEFVPYKYGCYSFLSYSDISTMIKYGLVVEDTSTGKWKKSTEESYLKIISKDDRKIVEYLYNSFKNKLGKKLIRYTYKKFPYYAINSLIAAEILDVKELAVVRSLRKHYSELVLATIGYEGISLEEYINRLINNDIKILVDVRKFPKSMKMGFSKNQLKNACNFVGIKYEHVPQVGIDSSLRKGLSDQESYDNLFKIYAKGFSDDLFVEGKNKIADLFREYGRVALTCFECNINQCHRKPLAAEIARDFCDVNIIHI